MREDQIIVGGQAVIEGVMMRAPHSYAVAVRRPDGQIVAKSERLPVLGEKYPLLKLPVLRGSAVLIQSMILGIKALNFSANVVFHEAEKETAAKAPEFQAAALTSGMVATAAPIALTAIVRGSGGAPIDLKVQRKGTVVDVQLSPRKDAASGIFMIGVRFGQMRARGPFLDAAKEAVVMPLALSAVLLTNIWDLIMGKIQGGLTGPLGIAKEMAGAAQQGVLKFLEILILISVALGVFNLLPLPGLDGGRIFFVGINAIRRRDMNPAVETKIHMVGIMVLLLLLVVVTFNDIKGIFFKKMG